MAGFGPPRTSKRQPERGLGSKAMLALPAAGRPGPPPPWPLGKKTAAVSELWAELWASPQAVAWEQLGWTRVVARYAACLVKAERPSASAALLAEVRQIEDRLGLSPMAMLRLRWEISTTEAKPEQPAELADVVAIYS